MEGFFWVFVFGGGGGGVVGLNVNESTIYIYILNRNPLKHKEVMPLSTQKKKKHIDNLPLLLKKSNCTILKKWAEQSIATSVDLQVLLVPFN